METHEQVFGVESKTRFQPGIVLEHEEGYLVIDPMSLEDQIVTGSPPELRCECWNSLVSSDGRCDHVRSVEAFLSGAGKERTMDQADMEVLLKRIAVIDAEVETHQESARVQTERIEAWLTSQIDRLSSRRRYLTQQLEAWMDQEGLKTRALVNGTIKLRAQRLKIEILDEDRVLENPRFRRVIPEKFTVDRNALRQYIESTGEEPEGVEVTPVLPKFSYRLNGEGA